MESEKLSARESLDIITNMIEQAKGNVKKNGFHFLLWGWIVATANIGMYVLSQIGYARPYLIWLITIPAWGISMYVGFRQSRVEHKTTHLDIINVSLWISFAVCIFTLIAFGSKIYHQLNPLIMLISAIPTFVSGVVIRFRALMLGGVLMWAAGIFCFLAPAEIRPLIGAAAVLFGFLVPGYLLRNKKE